MLKPHGFPLLPQGILKKIVEERLKFKKPRWKTHPGLLIQAHMGMVISEKPLKYVKAEALYIIRIKIESTLKKANSNEAQFKCKNWINSTIGKKKI